MPLPWARRKSKYDPPSLLELITTSPLALLISYIHALFLSLRGPSFIPPKNKPSIRIICISDTHSHTPTVPAGDLLIHAGDLTNDGTRASIQATLDWLNTLPHKHKVVIAGNHDNYFDPAARREEDKTSKTKTLRWGNITYLHNQSVNLKFKGGRSLNIYGSPDIPYIGEEHAFQYPPSSPPWPNRIPLSTDVLITHTPPAHHLDNSLGCPSLLAEIWRVKPRLHVFGHIHSGHGRERVFWDEGQAACEGVVGRRGGVLADLVPSKAWIDAARVVWWGVRGVLWQWLMVGRRGANGGLLVNAALTYQSTSDIGNLPEIVEL